MAYSQPIWWVDSVTAPTTHDSEWQEITTTYPGGSQKSFNQITYEWKYSFEPEIDQAIEEANHQPKAKEPFKFTKGISKKVE